MIKTTFIILKIQYVTTKVMVVNHKDDILSLPNSGLNPSLQFRNTKCFANKLSYFIIYNDYLIDCLI